MFQGDKKFGQSMLHGAEEALKRALLPLVPKRVETYHLTLLTIPWIGFILLFSYFARSNIHWLWGVSAMIAAQYITDLLDGAIGRQRDTGLIKWGFYMDHFLDFFFLCALLIGYAILLPRMHRTALFFVMAVFSGFMVNSFLSFAATNRFRIAYYGFGPTEIRITFILINTLLVFFGTKPLILALPYVLALATFGLFITVYREQQELWRIDMAAKHGHEAPPAAPSTRHRRYFAAAVFTALTGIWVATLAGQEIAVRLASLVLLAAAAAFFVLSLSDFRRFRSGRRFVLTALVHYLPYVATGLLLLIGLRVWFVLTPHGMFTPPAPDASLTPAALEQNAGLIRGTAAHVATNDAAALWTRYKTAEAALATLEDQYAGFRNIDAVALPRQHADAYTVYLAAYSQRCVLGLRLAAHLLENRAAWQGLDPATQKAMRRHIAKSSSDAVWLRLAAGRVYLEIHRDHASAGSPLPELIDTNLDYAFDRLPGLYRDSLIFAAARFF